MANNVYLLTDFSCCEDFENFLKGQNHANRAVLDAITAQVVGEWNRKACNIAILGGNLCLIDKYGNTLASEPVVIQDDDTISRDATGKASCVKIKAAGIGKSISLWVGTREQYNKLTNKTPNETAYFFTDYTISDIYNDITSIKNQIKSIQGGSSVEYDELNTWKESVMSGDTVVPKAKNATNATYAFSCGTASGAEKALLADKATLADKAKIADSATLADSAVSATKDASGNAFESTYGKFKGVYTAASREENIKLTAGTYQIHVNVHESGIEFASSLLVWYDGSVEICNTLNIEIDVNKTTMNVYRLRISKGGLFYVEKAVWENFNEDPVEYVTLKDDMSQSDYAIVYFRKVL